MNAIRSYVLKLKAEDITAGQCNGSNFLFITDFLNEKTKSKEGSRFANCSHCLCAGIYEYSCSFYREFNTDSDDTCFIALYLNTPEVRSILTYTHKKHDAHPKC